VSSTGSAQYTVPIDLPPGRGGFGPSLSINYNSSTGNGLLGVGWSLSGLSTIHLCPASIAQDGVNADGMTGVCLDGMRLVPVGYEQSTGKTQFRTEMESFSKIEAQGDMFYKPLAAEVYDVQEFVVQTKNGIRMVFGGNESAILKGADYRGPGQNAIKWALTSKTDRNGSFVRYEYSKLGKVGDMEMLPRWIGYNFGGVNRNYPRDLSASAEVVFHYLGEGEKVTEECLAGNDACKSHRVDGRDGYWAGHRYTETRVLEKVSILVSGKEVRSYELTYPPEYQDPMRIGSIRECTPGQTPQKFCSQPTTFVYGNAQSAVSRKTTSRQVHGVLDWNGDGYDDALTFEAQSDADGGHDVRVRLGGPTGLEVDGSLVGEIPAGTLNHSLDGESKNIPVVQTGDIDGNGTEDIVYYNRAADSVEVISKGFISNGQEWTAGLYDADNPKLRLVDFDGDGLKDFVLCRGDFVSIAMNTAAGFTVAPQQVDGYTKNACEGGVVANGADGRELLVFGYSGDLGATFRAPSILKYASYKNGLLGASLGVSQTPMADSTTYPASATPGFVGDFDADSNDDVLLVDSKWSASTYKTVFRYWVYRGTGTLDPRAGIGASIDRPNFAADGGKGEFILDGRINHSTAIDTNRDGYTDLLFSTSEANYRIDGRSLQAGGRIQPSPGPAGLRYHGYLVGDFNGDDRMDFVDGSVVDYGYGVGKIGLESVHVSTHSGDVPRVIEVTYAAGVAPETYAWANELGSCPSVITDHIHNTVRCLKRLPAPVVAEYTEYEYRQTAGVSEVTQKRGERFHYYSAVRDTKGRGWLGFMLDQRDRFGFSGVENESVIEVYDISKLSMGAWGPFLERPRTVGFEASEDPDYDYYLYPKAGIPAMVEKRVAFSGNEFTSSTELERTTRTISQQDVLGTDKQTLFVVPSTQTSEVFEGPSGEAQTLVSEVRDSWIEFDDFGNLKEKTTSWSGSGRATREVYRYEHDVDSTRIEKWQVDLVRSAIVENSADVVGPGSLERHTTNYEYNASGQLVEHTSDLGTDDEIKQTLVRSGYWGNVDHLSVSSPLWPARLQEWDLSYDPLGLFVSEVQNPEGHVERFTRSWVNGQVVRHTSPNNEQTTWSYDGFGRLTQQAQLDDGVSTAIKYESGGWDFDPTGQTGPKIRVNASTRIVTTTTNQAGGSVVSSEEYDARGRLVRTRSSGFAAGQEIVRAYEHDIHGRLARASRADLAGAQAVDQIEFGYDETGRPTTQKHLGANRERRTFYASMPTVVGVNIPRDDVVSIAVVRSPAGKQTAVMANALGEPVLSMEGDSSVEYSYGAGGFLLASIASDGSVIRRTPDQLARLVAVDDPDTGHHDYSLDPWGLVKTHKQNETDGDAIQNAYVYDRLGRPVSQENADGLTTFVWDQILGLEARTKNGEILQAKTSKGHQDDYFYEGRSNSLSHLRRQVQRSATVDSMQVAFEYDDFLRIQKLHYPGERGVVARYNYNANGFLESIDNGTDGYKFWQVTDTYRGLTPKRIVTGDGSVTERAYNPLTGELEGAKTTSGFDQSILVDVGVTYDPSGSVRSTHRRHDPLENTPRFYHYDAVERLERVTRGPSRDDPLLESFSYGATGNLEYKSGVGGYRYVRDGDVHSAPHAVKEAGEAENLHSYHYDVNGSMRSRSGPTVPGGEQTFEFTALGQLARVETEGAEDVSFEYGPGGDRVLRRVGDLETVFFGGLFERTQEESGEEKETYRIFAEGKVAVELLIETEDGAPQLSTRYLHRDHLGSVEVTTDGQGKRSEDASGQPIANQAYDAFGQRALPGAGSAEFGFTGHRDDGSVGLVDMGGRFYDARLGRFISADPYIPEPLSPQSYNRYSYVRNNPATLVDPSGYREDSPNQTLCILFICVNIGGGGGGSDDGGGGQVSGPDEEYQDWLDSLPRGGGGGGGSSPPAPFHPEGPQLGQSRSGALGAGDLLGASTFFGTSWDVLDPTGAYRNGAEVGLVALTGLIDGTLFNTSDYLRGLVGTDAVVNTDAAAYQVGQYSSMAMGLAGLAKGFARVGIGLAKAGIKGLAAAARVARAAVGAVDDVAARGTGAFMEGAQGGAGLGKLAGKSLNVSEKGLGIVEKHLAQFGDVPQNTAMIGRLRAALSEGRAISGADASFYMHEVAEATMMGRGMSYGAAHSGALAKYGVSPFSVYHPEVVQQFSSAFNSNWASFWGL
jgi:RHS repeat-associated protein